MALRLLLDHDAYARSGVPPFQSRRRAWPCASLELGIEELCARGQGAAGSRASVEGRAEPPRWVLHLRDRAVFTIASIAAWTAGALAVAPAHARSLVLLGASGPGDLVITDDAAVAVALRATHRVVDLSAWEGSAGAASRLDPAGGAQHRSPPVASGIVDERPASVEDTLAWGFETSGSRGEPTLHRRSLAMMTAEAATLAALLDLRAPRVLVGTALPTHLYGALFTIVAPLLAGVSVVCESPLYPGEILAALRETRASLLVSTPAHLSALVGAGEAELRAWTETRDFAGMDVLDVVSSGAALPTALAERLAALPNVRLTEILGATETGGIAWRRGAEPAYRPLPGVKWRVTGEALEIASPWSAPAASGDGFIETQEHVEAVADDRFMHLGRRDDVLKVGGRRVALAALERVLRETPGVDDVALAALAADGPRGVEVIGIVVAPSVMLDAGVDGVLSRVRGAFDPVVIPRRLRFVAAIARDARGKIGREQVIEAWRRAGDAGFAIEVQPATSAGSFTLRVPTPTAWTDGHFPGEPVVPGAALLAAIARAVEDHAAGWVCAVRGVKFHAKVSPGDTLEVATHASVMPPGARVSGGDDEAAARARGAYAVHAHRGDTLVLRAEFWICAEAST